MRLWQGRRRQVKLCARRGGGFEVGSIAPAPHSRGRAFQLTGKRSRREATRSAIPRRKPRGSACTTVGARTASPHLRAGASPPSAALWRKGTLRGSGGGGEQPQAWRGCAEPAARAARPQWGHEGRVPSGVRIEGFHPWRAQRKEHPTLRRRGRCQLLLRRSSPHATHLSHPRPRCPAGARSCVARLRRAHVRGGGTVLLHPSRATADPRAGHGRSARAAAATRARRGSSPSPRLPSQRGPRTAWPRAETHPPPARSCPGCGGTAPG